MGRSILAVLAGFATWSILWVVSNMTIAGAFPDAFKDDGTTESVGLLVLLLCDSAAFSFLSGWLTGVVAKRREMSHGVALGVALLAVGIAVQIGYWDVMPLWYHLGFLALLLPLATLGGKVRQKKS